MLPQPSGAPRQRGPELSADQPSQPAEAEQGPAQLPGLPRLFFPDQPAVPPAAPRPPHQPEAGSASAQPAAPPLGSRPGSVPVPVPQPARPSGPPRRELRHRAAAAALFGALSLFALSASGQAEHASYLLAFALVVGVAAAVLGITAARAARTEGTTRPRGSMAAIILGVVSVVLTAVTIFGMVFNSQLTRYGNCVQAAHGNAAQQACTRQFIRSLENHSDIR